MVAGVLVADSDWATGYVPVAIVMLALVFTVVSFWWLYARKGSITATTPRAYAFGGTGALLRLRLPFAFVNDGARALVVSDLRIVGKGESGRPELRWVTTRDRLRPEKDDGFAYATPFSIAGRSSKEAVVEFEPSVGLNWSPAHGVALPLELQAQIHPDSAWIRLVTFDWWAPTGPQARAVRRTPQRADRAAPRLVVSTDMVTATAEARTWLRMNGSESWPTLANDPHCPSIAQRIC